MTPEPTTTTTEPTTTATTTVDETTGTTVAVVPARVLGGPLVVGQGVVVAGLAAAALARRIR